MARLEPGSNFFSLTKEIERLKYQLLQYKTLLGVAPFQKEELKGDPGPEGPRGLRGEQGTPGPKGDKGDKGDTGAKGDTGNTGAQGIKGDKGDRGEKGNTGATGATGATGPRGLQGIQGEKGDKGEQGIQGIQGIQGLRGYKGDTGKYGETKFVINDNMELEQHTLIGDPLNFAIVNDELVLTEGGETVNLGTVAIKDTYSYDEQRIGTWVNGKPIYRKVFLLPTNGVVEDIQIVHNLGIELYIHSDIVSNYIYGDNSPSTPLLTGQYQTTSITLSQNNMFMYEFHSEPDFTYHLIIEYTKL